MRFFHQIDWRAALRSRTLWVNGLVASMVLAEQNIAQLQGFLPDGTYKVVAFSLPIVNLWLRLGTTKPLTCQSANNPQPGV